MAYDTGAIIISIFRWEFGSSENLTDLPQAYVIRWRLEPQMSSHSCKLVRGLVSGKYSSVSIQHFVFSSSRVSTRLFLPLFRLLTSWLPLLALLLLLLKQDCAQGLALALLADFPPQKGFHSHPTGLPSKPVSVSQDNYFHLLEGHFHLDILLVPEGQHFPS